LNIWCTLNQSDKKKILELGYAITNTSDGHKSDAEMTGEDGHRKSSSAVIDITIQLF